MKLLIEKLKVSVEHLQLSLEMVTGQLLIILKNFLRKI